jgi:hypothetical protein
MLDKPSSEGAKFADSDPFNVGPVGLCVLVCRIIYFRRGLFVDVDNFSFKNVRNVRKGRTLESLHH